MSERQCYNCYLAFMNWGLNDIRQLILFETIVAALDFANNIFHHTFPRSFNLTILEKGWQIISQNKKGLNLKWAISKAKLVVIVWQSGFCCKREVFSITHPITLMAGSHWMERSVWFYPIFSYFAQFCTIFPFSGVFSPRKGKEEGNANTNGLTIARLRCAALVLDYSR